MVATTNAQTAQTDGRRLPAPVPASGRAAPNTVRLPARLSGLGLPGLSDRFS
jgi:hypothetical protein